MESDSEIEIVDSHCHLNFDLFDDDRDAVVENARRIGISRILNPGIDIETSKSAIEIAHTYPEVFAAVGVHPNQGLSWNEHSLPELRKLAKNDKVVAIGEIGLDYYRQVTPVKVQQSIFTQQLELAAELGLPVVIHLRDSAEDLVKILREWYSEVLKSGSILANNPGVIHSFSGEPDLANELALLNFKIGISGPVTFRNSHQLQSTVVNTPIESILVETDAPFLAPHPNRGKRNEPANVRIVADKIADLKDTSLNEIALITKLAADKLFKWSENH